MGKMGRSGAAAAAVLLALLGEAGAFYLPGVAPRKYKTGERMRVKVNTLTSDLTPLQVIRTLP
jgi:transmembrane 9 superfamily protein 2/4